MKKRLKSEVIKTEVGRMVRDNNDRGIFLADNDLYRQFIKVKK